MARVIGCGWPLIACLAAPALPSLRCSAQQLYPAPAVKAAYLYRFAGYIEWPKVESTAAEFTIVVVSAHDIALQLGELSHGRQINGKSIHVEEWIQGQEIPSGQMAYIGPDFHSDVRRMIESLEKRHTVVVTDQPDGLHDGSLINFVLVDQRIRFEVSLTAARRGGFGISSELLAVAARVEGQNSAVNLKFDPTHVERRWLLLMAQN